MRVTNVKTPIARATHSQRDCNFDTEVVNKWDPYSLFQDYSQNIFNGRLCNLFAVTHIK